MAETTSGLFDPQLVNKLINTVSGDSILAKLATRKAIPFNGSKEFMFSMDSDIDIVAEAGAKSEGGITLTPKTVVPIKFEYGARVSDEFLYATEDEKLDVLDAFTEGFAAKVARGIDLAAFHGINPRTSSASAVVGTNHFDSLVTTEVTYNASTPDDNISDAIAAVQAADGTISGIALAPTMGTALGNMKTTAGARLYPEFMFGGAPGSLGGNTLAMSKNLSDASYSETEDETTYTCTDMAIVGDFQKYFRWGYSKQIPTEIIKYGDPDNTGHDLKGYNQVYIRAEIYLGWGILLPDSFARVVRKVEQG